MSRLLNDPNSKDAIAQPAVPLEARNAPAATLRRVLVAANAPPDSAQTFRNVDSIESVLDRICLEGSRRDFELVLGCYVTPDNFDQCLLVLDLCLQYNATPEYFLWPDLPGIRTILPRTQVKEYESVMDRLDKELWARGWPRAPLGPALSQLNVVAEPFDLVVVSGPQLVFCDGSQESVNALLRGADRCSGGGRSLRIGVSERAAGAERLGTVLARGRSVNLPVRTFGSGGERLNPSGNETELLLPNDVDRFTVQALVSDARSSLTSRAVGQKHLTLHATHGLRTFWKEVSSGLAGAEVDHCSLEIPFWMDGRAVSALEWLDILDAVRDMCLSRRWFLEGGRPDLLSLGLDLSNQFPEIIDVCSRKEHGPSALSVLVPVYNRESVLPTFLRSVAANAATAVFDLVLVDDGSRDRSWDVLVDHCRRMPGIDYSIVRLGRQNPYAANTFTFRTGAARQAALQFAGGERILFFDPDQIIDRNCISEHLYWGALGYDVVLGVRCYPGADLVHRTRVRMRHVSPVASYKHWWGWFFTGNASVSRRAFQAAGGFDETLQFWGLDDMDLGYRLEKTGARCWHTPRARVAHLPDIESGGGRTRDERAKSCRFQMEVLFRKYLDPDILSTYSRFWSITHSGVSGTTSEPAP